MKKFFLLTLTILFSLALFACGSEATTSTKPKQNTTKQPGQTTKHINSTVVTTQKVGNPTFWDKDGNGVEDWLEEEITLRFATWAYNDYANDTIDSLMAQAFTLKYPNIKVEMQLVGQDYEFEENMIALLDATVEGEESPIPDVFLINRLANFLPYGFLADITQYYDNDPDTEYIFESVKSSGIFDGKRYAIPTFIYPTIYFVNLTILKNAGIDIPSYNWTWDQMEAIGSAAYNETRHIFGIYGTSGYTRELTKVLKGDNTWSASSFDGTKFNFDDQVWDLAFARLKEGIDKKAVQPTLGAETLEEYYNDGTIDPRYAGYAAIWRDATWAAKEFFDTMDFEWDVYPGPNGISGGNTDIAGVSALSTHKAAAYQLLKWMTYGEDGILTRFSLYEQYKDVLFMSGNNYPFPIVDYGIDLEGHNKIWESIPYGSTAPGFTSSEMLASLKNGALWLNKEVVGWDAVDTVVNPYFYALETGEYNSYAEVRSQIVTGATEAYNQATQALRDLINLN